jgi:hypothetical protein
MKASNLILSACGASVIAFDATREYDSETVFNRLQQRDLDRFIRNWQGCPEIRAFFKSRLTDWLFHIKSQIQPWCVSTNEFKTGKINP